MKYYSVMKTEWNFGTCKYMNGPRGYYADWYKSDREKNKHCLISLTCGI